MNSKYKKLIVEAEETNDFLEEGRKFTEEELKSLGSTYAEKSTYTAKQIPGLDGLKDGWGEKVKGEAVLKKYNAQVQQYEKLRKQLLNRAVPDAENSRAKKTMKTLSKQIASSLAELNKYAKIGKQNLAGKGQMSDAERRAADKKFDKEQKTKASVDKGFKKIRKQNFKDSVKRNVALRNKAKVKAEKAAADRLADHNGKEYVNATLEDDLALKPKKK